MKGQSIKELLNDYKIELDHIDFDDDFELMNLFAVRGQLIDRFENFTINQLSKFEKLEVEFIKIIDKLKGFEEKIVYQNSLLYTKLRKVA